MARRPVVALVALAEGAKSAAADHLARRGFDLRVANAPWEAEALLAAGGTDAAVVAGRTEQALALLRRFGGGDRPAFLLLLRGPSTLDRVLALELGAADVAEPDLAPRELAARIAAVLRRTAGYAPELLVLEDSTVDLRASLVMHHRTAQEELLSPGQLAMLKLFASRPRIVLSRDEVLAAAPAEDIDAFDRSVDSRIVRLRRKLDTTRIVTVRGMGYRFDPPDEDRPDAHRNRREPA